MLQQELQQAGINGRLQPQSQQQQHLGFDHNGGLRQGGPGDGLESAGGPAPLDSNDSLAHHMSRQAPVASHGSMQSTLADLQPRMERVGSTGQRT